MTEKRFSTNGYYIYDHFHDGEKWLVNEVEAEEIVSVMNNLDIKARERSKALSKLQKENNDLKEKIKLIFGQIKAFRDDCVTYSDFDGAGTLNRLSDILKSSMEIWK